MLVTLNGKELQVKNGDKVVNIASDFDVFVCNGYGVDKNRLLAEGDKIIAVKKGELPDDSILQEMLLCRNGDFVTSRVKNACVCICGLGGLGSNIAVMLARLGVGKLILVDFDIVDPTNLNRQNYFVCDIGQKKTIATKNHILQVNPYIEIECVDAFLDSNNILKVIEKADIVVEAFDNPESKATLINEVLQNTSKRVVASSGMAGFDSANSIITKKRMSRLYVVGDDVSEAKEGESLMSPRVMVCAGHQANMVLRLLLGIENV